jgi:two-component system OmpR family response regulator
MSSEPHIIVVDDHSDIRDLVGAYLSKHGFKVSVAESGAALRKLLDRMTADLVILDVMMPGEDGLAVCRQLRSNSDLPVIFLTAMADDTDRIIGLELGADDYLVKPFNPRELLARVRAVLRRSSNIVAPREIARDQVIAFEGWSLNVRRRELHSAEGLGVALSTAEFRLLKVFLDNPHSVLTRDELLNRTVGRAADTFDRSIDNQVSRLRKKIEPDPKNPTIIQTHWGGGYSLSVGVVITS